MEKLFMELERSMNGRKNFASSNNSSHINNINGGFGFQYPNNHSLQQSSSNIISQLLLNANAMANFRGSLNLSPPLYSPPPPSTLPLLPPHAAQYHQPPLLPLPIKSAATLPSANNKLMGLSWSRPNNQKRKKTQQPKPRTNNANVPKKEEKSEALKPAERKNPAEEEDTEEEILIGSGSLSVYSLSPPPSSVPMPKLLLMTRPRPRQCNAEAMDAAGATNDLRKLLRL